MSNASSLESLLDSWLAAPTSALAQVGLKALRIAHRFGACASCAFIVCPNVRFSHVMALDVATLERLYVSVVGKCHTSSCGLCADALRRDNAAMERAVSRVLRSASDADNATDTTDVTSDDAENAAEASTKLSGATDAWLTVSLPGVCVCVGARHSFVEI